MISRAEYDQRKATLDSPAQRSAWPVRSWNTPAFSRPSMRWWPAPMWDNFQGGAGKQPVVTACRAAISWMCCFQMPENLLINLRSIEENRDYHLPSVIPDSLPAANSRWVHKRSTAPSLIPRPDLSGDPVHAASWRVSNLLPGMDCRGQG